jgi:integral membrane sensor domain MASE1
MMVAGRTFREEGMLRFCPFCTFLAYMVVSGAPLYSPDRLLFHQFNLLLVFLFSALSLSDFLYSLYNIRKAPTTAVLNLPDVVIL